MTRGSALISMLEKIRAGLGAAGMAAVTVEAFGLLLAGHSFSGFPGLALAIAAAAVSAVAAFHFTEVSGREAALRAAAAKESVLASIRD